MAVHWPDRHLWTERVFRTRAAIIGLNDRYPWALTVVGLPLTVIAFVGVVTYPTLFVPLLLLIGVALVVIEYYAEQQKAGGYQAQVSSGTQKWNPQSRGGQPGMRGGLHMPRLALEALARAEAADAQALAAQARARAAEAQTLAAEATKQAEVAEARARAAQLHLLERPQVPPA
jgi:colicin import membrane protein